MQLDSMDCGPTCLQMVSSFYGKSYSLRNLRERCHITREGVSMLGISDAAESIGFRTAGVKITWEQLRDEANLPCIVHWNQRHFVVVYKIAKTKRKLFSGNRESKGYEVYVSDPAEGLLKYKEEQFLKSWQTNGKGFALLLEPTPAFYKEKGDEDKRMGFAYVLKYLLPYRNYVAQLLLSMLIAGGLSLLLPFLTQSVVDTGIGTGNIGFVVMILIAQVVLVLGQMANNLIKSWLMLHMTTRISIKGLTLAQTQEVGGTFIDQTKNVLISFMAASSVIKGGMTLGMMMAMQYIIGQLNAPISQFISFVQSTQDAKISLDRMSEITEKDDEEPDGIEKIRNIPGDSALEFQNVVFQYEGPYSDKVLNNISLTIPPNKVTAVVGASGSGKTTMLKMILGFYKPVEGKVLLGGRKLDLYSESCWRKICGAVMQEGYIFSDTIANNIGVSEEVPDMSKVRRSAKLANIDTFIDELPLGYSTKIGASGHGLSSGQKQRLLIARAAYKDARYLIFDEATNSLDANNEKQIMENLNMLFRGKTVIIAAHRLSTVKEADNIVVLDKGVIAEEGTHKDLIAKRGYYYQLIKNQLELGN
jgi:ABC-type bacteriocin/lantibiotic exporter with double-glycine peptidase domain